MDKITRLKLQLTVIKVEMILTESPENGLLAFESASWLMVKNTFFR